eukprot:gene53904-73743_t
MALINLGLAALTVGGELIRRQPQTTRIHRRMELTTQTGDTLVQNDRNWNRRTVLGVASVTAAALATGPARAQAPASLAGRTVLITGSSAGFGRLSALHLAGLGATVIASMRNLEGGQRPDAVSLLQEAKGLPGKVHPVDMD